MSLLLIFSKKVAIDENSYHPKLFLKINKFYKSITKIIQSFNQVYRLQDAKCVCGGLIIITLFTH